MMPKVLYARKQAISFGILLLFDFYFVRMTVIIFQENKDLKQPNITPPGTKKKKKNKLQVIRK